MSKLLLLSFIIGMVVIPTRLSKGTRGPQHAVFLYLVLAAGYYFILRFVIARVGV
jgi:hypothetical protein